MTTPFPASHVPPTPSRRQKAGARITLTLASLAMIGPFTIDTVFPAFTRIGEEFASDEVALQQLVSAYLAAFAVMSIFHGPLSDALGRKKVMIGGLVIYLIGMFGCVLAPSLGSLILLRVLQGMSAGAATIVSRVVIRDMFSGSEAQRLMAQVMMIFSVAPAIAPIFGGWLLLLGDWRWVFAGVGVYGLVVLALTLKLPETLPPEARSPLRVRSLLGSLLHVGRSPVMLRVAAASAFGFASQFVFIAGASLFVVRLLGLGEQDFWVLFVPLIIGMMSGAWMVGRVADLVDRSRLITLGFLGTLVATILNLVLVSFAPEFTGGVTWAHLFAVTGPMLIAFTVALLFAPIQLEVLDLFPHERGAAASLGTFFGLVLNALLAGAIAPLVATSLATLAATSLGFALLGGVFWAWHILSIRRPVEA
ncbi:multidrug effflux MFS transporter [Brachybacterium sp. FME24]|uniref:multidrug effflux MFS transporter n=1 Tax=Brachybacterium sp. FME24 TaxID=2742605 RepID=UPI0027152897|nr:multidrug effflux MFS transporter [Brachybacterium sp. FME24]